jgi:hypothetical protein
MAMRKIVQKIHKCEQRLHNFDPKELIENINATFTGDMKNVINQLHMMSYQARAKNFSASNKLVRMKSIKGSQKDSENPK